MIDYVETMLESMIARAVSSLSEYKKKREVEHWLLFEASIVIVQAVIDDKIKLLGSSKRGELIIEIAKRVVDQYNKYLQTCHDSGNIVFLDRLSKSLSELSSIIKEAE